MREIKFRGMGIDGGWNYGLLTVLERNYMRIEKGHYISNSMGVPFAYHVRPETVGQYTGLKDKNGKEIYEGDILKDVLSQNKSVLINTVIFEQGAFKHHFHNEWTANLRGSDKDYMFGNTSTIFEVIGNIYEHPHLLEGRDEA